MGGKRPHPILRIIAMQTRLNISFMSHVRQNNEQLLHFLTWLTIVNKLIEI